MTTPTFYTTENLKRIYTQGGSNLDKSMPSISRNFRGMGTKPIAVTDGGWVTALKLGRNGTVTYPNGTSLSHAGTTGAQPVEQLGMTATHMFARTSIVYQRVDNWKRNGNLGAFFDETAESVKDCIAALHNEFDRGICRGSALVCTVTTTSAAIAAAASGTIAVDAIEYVADDAVYQVNRSGVIADVILNVTNPNHGVGAGNIVVTNNGGTSYTPTANDTFYVAYYTDQVFWEGLGSDVATGAYPTSQGNNIQVNNTLFDSYTTSGSSAAVATAMLEWMRMKVMQQVPLEDINSTLMENRMTQTTTAKYVFLMRNNLVQALLSEWYTRRQQWSHEGFPDLGWGFTPVLDGVPIVGNDTLPADTVFFLYVPGFSAEATEPVPMFSSEMGVWNLKDTSTEYESQWHQAGAYLCVLRSAQGKITSVTGQTATAAGLTV